LGNKNRKNLFSTNGFGEKIFLNKFGIVFNNSFIFAIKPVLKPLKFPSISSELYLVFLRRCIKINKHAL